MQPTSTVKYFTHQKGGSDWVCPKLGRLWFSDPGQFLGS